MPRTRWYALVLWLIAVTAWVPQHAHGARHALTEQRLFSSAEEAEDGWECCGVTEEPEPLQECQARVDFWLSAKPLLQHSTVTCLRSPCNAAWDVRIFSTRCCGV